ncbi:MAG: radical SAM protein, partial [Solirubrobacterales bacterium]
MRWDSQRVDRERGRSLPGLDVERVRTFDAPEALGINFHEVRAKSALNKVPGDYLPFNYTVNAFRGCAHACTYCLSGDTPILMADGRTKSIADLKVGDQIYGTERGETYRRYVTTEVLAHWETYKDAYRLRLEDGTELIASEDHRFRTRRGKWKHVIGTEQGPLQRPHLTLNDQLAGVGHFARQPETDDPVYRRGYLCGLIRGDANLATYDYRAPGRSPQILHRFRLALADFEALRRAQEYLRDLDLDLNEFVFADAAGSHREIRAIRDQTRLGFGAIQEAIAWPRGSSHLWAKGFLAGIFDAEGSYSQGVFRIANSDPEIIDWTTWALKLFDFDFAVERGGKTNGMTFVRIRGGLREVLRFFHLTDPAITRKRSIDGVALTSDANLGVVSIVPVGRRRLFDITSGTGDFIADGVVSHNCFARNTHTYLDLDAGRDFEREIVVKVNVPELLRAELSRPSWKREVVAFGTNTDPYQWAEGRYELMPPMIEALRDTHTPTSILTKSSLALRDLDLCLELAEVADVSVNFSVPTLDEKIWRQTEPHTPHPRKRLEAVAKFNEAGIPSGVLVAPLMPGINDSPELVEEIVSIAEEAGATFVNGIALHLRPGVKEVFMSWLSAARPDLVPRYEDLYDGRAYAPNSERKRIGALVRAPNRSTDPRYRRREQLAER